MGRSLMASGVEAIEEAAMLMRRIRFSVNRPAYAEGKRVAISLDPRWSNDSETMRVLITCHGLTLQPVDWERLRINIESKDHSIVWLAFLNTRGQAVRDGLPPGGEYSLSLPCRVKSQIVEHVLPNPRRQIRKRGGIQWNYETDETKESSIRGEEASPREAIIQEGRTREGSLVWSVTESDKGEVRVSLEAEEEMAGRRLAVTLIESVSGLVQYDGVLTLVPAATIGKSEGRLKLGRYAEVNGPCDLVFEELGPADTETR